MSIYESGALFKRLTQTLPSSAEAAIEDGLVSWNVLLQPGELWAAADAVTRSDFQDRVNEEMQ